MSQLTFYGATGTVTGSRHFLQLNNNNYLVDCGMFQGKKENRQKNWEPFPVPVKEINRVFLTHAHIDHSGFFPRLVKDGYRGPVHCTHATRDLCNILLMDSAHLQEEDAFWANKKGYSKHSPALPLFTTADAEQALTLFQPKFYGEDYFIEDGIRVKFKDAGHILGSSFVEFKTSDSSNTRKILFSGDMGRPRSTVLRDPTQVFNVDYLVLESTYGDRLHDDGDPAVELARVVNASVERGGVLVIPSFAVGRTQTLLYVLRELEEAGKIPALPVYVDSPMAIKTTDVFDKHQADFNLPSRILTLSDKDIFQPKNLHIARTREQSMMINEISKNAIILSASGMATGGRILHHLEIRLPNPKNTILLIGYQAEGTRGRTIEQGNPTVKIHGQEIPIKAHIEKITGYSGHADYNEILAWLMGFNRPPKKTFIVHGEPEASASLAEKIRSRFNWDVVIPEYGSSHELDMD
ncbi:MAG TPA: MBL fold metallo-hydrolase [bacterium]|nr:MBL fold metallo-hydrolase [bacterium]HPN45756.1 MBL fold metallo-hydrolase [bacterium]